jgi:hypothetical protein
MQKSHNEAKLIKTIPSPGFFDCAKNAKKLVCRNGIIFYVEKEKKRKILC